MSLLLAALLAAAAPAVTAQSVAWPSSITAGELGRLCQETRDPRYWDGVATCRAYVIGAVDAQNMAFALAGARRYCTPKAVTIGAVTEATARFIASHPQHGREGAAAVVMLAMIDAYPCKAAK